MLELVSPDPSVIVKLLLLMGVLQRSSILFPYARTKVELRFCLVDCMSLVLVAAVVSENKPVVEG